MSKAKIPTPSGCNRVVQPDAELAACRRDVQPACPVPVAPRLTDANGQRLLDAKDENVILRCRACRRPLRTEVSRVAGIGKACLRKQRAAVPSEAGNTGRTDDPCDASVDG